MGVFEPLQIFFINIGGMLISPTIMLLLFSSVIMGIVFGATPGLTATLGVALLTTLTYSMDTSTAMVALMGIYVGGVYGGSYTAILVNIPGTAASAATALDGYPLACKGQAGRALGLTTTSSAIGTFIGMMFVVMLSPVISAMALQFTSFEFFLLALFGIVISGTLTSQDLVYKGWIAGFLGLFLATIGRDKLQFYPRFTFGMSELEGGLDLVPVLIGAFGIPQIMSTIRDNFKIGKTKKFDKIIPDFKTIAHNTPAIIRSSLIGVGIGSVPGIGEDIAGWVSYGAAKKASKHPEEFGNGSVEAVISTETANNSCIGGAMIPLLTLGVPGSPPAAMLLGALLLHGIQPGPMLMIDHPTFILDITAILLLASLTMWVCGILLAKQVIKVLKIPTSLFMPVIAVLCVIGSYALGIRIFNLYLMLPIGIIAYFLSEMKYPIAPLIIGVSLGDMCDQNLRRAQMVSQGSFLPVITRPVSLILFILILLLIAGQIPVFQKLQKRIGNRINLILKKKSPKTPEDMKD
ncbi:tripartite tricarboxylate transporter permease [Oceanispirochaeta sp.]|jgi:putative tricarboxylic transport membrane protein|uniref:tripartite tricarboxylate transporter permease n=1 Tax=Oceanispirochaeta sp. TaxID=2035350 RepID=UPI0026097A4E|nr:tripartite tricarboxylate transporter permease [Oceanispirochaeta sp.]MDA3956086.1 tripartite tricarboxylate transporter permease [Oceanispirochaeta sp.]